MKLGVPKTFGLSVNSNTNINLYCPPHAISCSRTHRLRVLSIQTHVSSAGVAARARKDGHWHVRSRRSRAGVEDGVAAAGRRALGAAASGYCCCGG